MVWPLVCSVWKRNDLPDDHSRIYTMSSTDTISRDELQKSDRSDKEKLKGHLQEVANKQKLPEAANDNVVKSEYLLNRLFNTPENNLFNYVKFHLVSQHIKRAGIACPRIMDIGCGLKVANRFLSEIGGKIHYFGIDYESGFQPDAVVDINQAGSLKGPMTWSPDVIMLLDVLEHLHDNQNDLERVIEHVSLTMPDNARVIITVPQLYRLDRFKLDHLYYPEHKIRLTQKEWRTLIEKHFHIQSTQGVGYLSVLPYLPMFSNRYTPDNALGRLFSHLRSHTFEKPWLKPVDLFISNTLGRLPLFKSISNDILFVATSRRSNSESNPG